MTNWIYPNGSTKSITEMLNKHCKMCNPNSIATKATHHSVSIDGTGWSIIHHSLPSISGSIQSFCGEGFNEFKKMAGMLMNGKTIAPSNLPGEKFWMVYRVGSRGPEHMHLIDRDAVREAKRLACQHSRGCFIVLEAVKAVYEGVSGPEVYSYNPDSGKLCHPTGVFDEPYSPCNKEEEEL